MYQSHYLSRTDQRIILIYYCLFFLLLVPFWWNLTRLDRHPLPRQAIHNLQSQTLLKYPLRLKWSGKLPSEDVEKELNRNWNQVQASPISFNNSGYLRELVPTFSIINAEGSLTDLKTVWHHVQVQPLSMRPKEHSGVSLLAKNNGNLTIFADTENEAIQILSRFIEFYMKTLVSIPPRIPFARFYELLFSFLFESIPKLKSKNYLDGALPYIYPFLDTLLGPEAYRVVSHIQAFAPLRPGLVVQGETIPSHQLPHFVNPTWHIAPLEKSTVHMLRYIPDSSLYILDDQQKKRPYNDYIVPRWGSVAIVNKERDLMRAESQSQLMVAHLRTLFGVPDLNHHVVNNHVFKFEHGPHGISYFELQLYQHQHILTSIIVSTETLSALIRLVDKQTRLPIPHSLKEVTEETCTLIQQSHLFYKESYLQALEAREKSEAAFLDPRMVGMVYFPDEHLFAIYLPLFLPLLASLAKKLRQEWKITKQEKAILLENKMK